MVLDRVMEGLKTIGRVKILWSVRLPPPSLMILTFLLIIQPSPFSFWVPYVHRPCTHDFRWGHKARYVQIYPPHTMAPYLPPSFYPLCSRTSSDVIPTIHHLCTCLTDIFTSINGLDTSCPSLYLLPSPHRFFLVP